MLRSTASRVIAIGLFTVAAIAGFTTASLGGDRLPVRAEQGEVTYILSDFAVEYPFGDESTAGVTWRSALATGTLPGQVECAIEVSDAEGGVVGSQTFTYTLIGSESGPHSPTAVPVQGVPAEASGYCEAAGDGAAVDVGALSVDPSSERSMAHLVADVSWDGERPGEQFCVVSLEKVEGGLTELPFTFDPVHMGPSGVTLLGGALEDATPTGMACQPLAGLELAQIEAAVAASK